MNLVEEAISKVLKQEVRKSSTGGADLTKLGLRDYIKQTGFQGDNSNNEIFGELEDNYYNGVEDGVIRNLTELYKKDKNVNIKKELDLWKKIAALKNKSELGKYF